MRAVTNFIFNSSELVEVKNNRRIWTKYRMGHNSTRWFRLCRWHFFLFSYTPQELQDKSERLSQIVNILGLKINKKKMYTLCKNITVTDYGN